MRSAKERSRKALQLEKSRWHSRGSHSTENEPGDWKVLEEVLTLKTCLDLFSFLAMFSSQDQNTKQIKDKERAFEICIYEFFSYQPPVFWWLNLFLICHTLGKVGMRYQASQPGINFLSEIQLHHTLLPHLPGKTTHGFKFNTMEVHLF